MNTPLLRVILAVSDRTAESRLTTELPRHGVQIVARALDGPSLVDALQAPGIDVVLLSLDLHRLDRATLERLRGHRRPIVALAHAPDDHQRYGALIPVLPAGTPSASIVAALREAEARGALATVAGERGAPELTAPADRSPGIVIGVGSGKGAPGKTTVAIGLATELGRQGHDVTLVDGDLRGGNVAAYLDLDPRRGLVAAAAGSGPLGQRVAAEIQPGPHLSVLAGLERPEFATMLPAGFLDEVIDELRQQCPYVVVDLGTPPPASVLRAVDHLVVVTGPDLVSIWNTRVALPAFQREIALASLHLLVNRREERAHYTATEVEAALGTPVLGAVREDRRAARDALTRRRALSDVGHGAARDLRAATARLIDAVDVRAGAAVPDLGAPALLAEG